MDPARPSVNKARKDICIVGAGPSGLAALQVITASPQFKAGFWKATAFEARESIGGVWLPALPTDDPPLTPLYDSLTTNLPHPIMAYSTFQFPPSTPLFPPAATVLQYLDDYAAHFNLTPHIRFNTPVQTLDWDPSLSKWRVRVTRNSPPGTDAQEEQEETHLFDFAVIANGHYRLPRYPSTPGLAPWLASSKASHSCSYRNPLCRPFGPTVLVIGAGPSGQDISAELLAAGHTVLHSTTHGTREDLLPAPSHPGEGALKRRARIAEFLDADRGCVRYVDGTTDEGITHVVLATGYQLSFPFLPPPLLRLALPPPVPPLPSTLYNSSWHVFPLARHVFPLACGGGACPTAPVGMAFVGLPVRVVPFPLVEAQMRAVVRAVADEGALDVAREAVGVVSRYEDLRARVAAGKLDNDDDEVAEEDRAREMAIAKAWHVLDGDAQFDYRDEMHGFAGGEYAGEEWRVPGWVREMYAEKAALRSEWRELERTGEAAEWVRGVGEAGGEDAVKQWVEVLRRLLKRVHERRQASADSGNNKNRL